jgi:hypothetical protein
MKRVHIHLIAGRGSSRSSNLLGAFLIALVLLGIVLLALGLWLLLAVGIVFVTIAALVRALLPWHRRRPPMVESRPAVRECAALVVDENEVQPERSSHTI